jgi:hypothetical protein
MLVHWLPVVKLQRWQSFLATSLTPDRNLVSPDQVELRVMGSLDSLALR